MSDQFGSNDEQLKLKKESLDKDLEKLVVVEHATRTVSAGLLAPGIVLVFLGLAAAYAGVAFGTESNVLFIVIAAMLGGYMALNIGANDVANNVGPAVGSKALTMFGALIIAAVFESAGALIAGGDVVSTISKGIIDPQAVADSDVFMWVMMAALMSSALWVNLATIVGAPVSTTHSVVGGVMGAGIAAAGVSAVSWSTMGAIAASWVISPALGGIVAAAFLWFIKANIIYQDDKISAARRWVPVLIAVMAAVFSCYLVTKGLKKIWRPDYYTVIFTGLVVFAVAYGILKPWVRRKSEGLENRNQSLRVLFHIPLICSAALLSFAHGANDVANAVGPLAAILHVAHSGDVATKVSIPLWVMVIGAAGISLGLFLYGPRLIRMVGEQITKMNPMRAFCVALAAAITVIFDSGLGLPVSSTHIAVGAVFGVGFFREYYTTHSKRRRQQMQKTAAAPSGGRVGGTVQVPKTFDEPAMRQSRKLVRRSHFLTIVAAWVITVPAAASLAAIIFFVLRLTLSG